MYNAQKQDSTRKYFISNYSLLSDYPTSLINEKGTTYPYIIIEKPHNIAYIRICAVTEAGNIKQICGFANPDIIKWGNILS